MTKKILRLIINILSSQVVDGYYITEEKLECGHVIQTKTLSINAFTPSKRHCRYCLHNVKVLENYEKELAMSKVLI